jgi:hypothetical protein
MTIKISFDADGAASATTLSGTAGAPAPMTLDALQGADSRAPAPMSPGELASSQGGAAATDTAPPPMAIEQLLSAGSTAAPAPEPLGALQAVGGAPAPRPLEELGTAAGGEAPKPLEPSALEGRTTTTRPTTRRGGGRRNPGRVS